MKRSVVIKLDGDLERDGLQVFVDVGEVGKGTDYELKGRLPACPSLFKRLERWRKSYREIDASFRLKLEEVRHTSTLTHRLQNCQQQAEDLTANLANWLDGKEFRDIDRQLRTELGGSTAMHVLIRTQDRRLCQLPWHQWDLIQNDRCAGIAFSTGMLRKIPRNQPNEKQKVRILAILGDSQGIDVNVDRAILEKLPNAEVQFLVAPDRNAIDNSLWQQRWDVLFFAGHSETQGNQGRLYINPTESLSIHELKAGLSHTIKQGLQIAIFNSCDGLGLAHELEDLYIPYMIVMREPIPDRVAHAFAKYFLECFSANCSFWEAQKIARQRLHFFENKYPCASWMPTIFQNPAAIPPTWQVLSGEAGMPDLLDRQSFESKTPGKNVLAEDAFYKKTLKGKNFEKEAFDQKIENESLSRLEKVIHEGEIRNLFKLGEARIIEFLDEQEKATHPPKEPIIIGLSQRNKSELNLRENNERLEYRIRYEGKYWYAVSILSDDRLNLSSGQKVNVVARIGGTCLLLPQGYKVIRSDAYEIKAPVSNRSLFSPINDFFKQIKAMSGKSNVRQKTRTVKQI